jgi:hypothetical protein
MSRYLATLAFLAVTCGWPTSSPAAENGEITGRVVNGTAGRQPLPGTEVVLRANLSSGFEPIATTTTDEQGRFRFGNLALHQRAVFLPGANRHDVHFPGPRVRLDHEHPSAEVELVAYDAVQSPSPLVVRHHDIAVRVDTGFMEITEALALENPSLTAYVGEPQEDRPTITLRIGLPAGFETVTFGEEFLGRSFLIRDNQLVTDLPWPPGKRELRFVYRLPVEQRTSVLRRVLDLPTDRVTLRVTGQDPRRIACDLPAVRSEREGEVEFASDGPTLAAGRAIELRMGDLPIRWESYARWGSLAVLSLLSGGVLIRRRWRKLEPSTSSPPTPRTGETARRGRRSSLAGRSP